MKDSMRWRMAAVLAASATVVPANAGAITIERVAAVAGDDVITLQDIRDEGGIRYAVKGMDIRDLDTDIHGAEKLEELTRELVQVRLIARQARKNDIHVGDREVDMQLSEMYRRSGQNEEAFRRMMDENGIDWYAYRRYMRGEIEAQYVMRSELAGQVVPSEVDVMACAREAAPDEEKGVSVTIRQILIPEIRQDTGAGLSARGAAALNAVWWDSLDGSVLRVAEGVRELAVRNTDVDRFSGLVHRFSTGRSVERDGVLGTFVPSDLSKDFSVVFTLARDEISPLVSTAAGYHILRVDDVQEGESENWKRVVNQCREQIMARESQRLIESWLNDLMEKNYVSITVNEDIRGR